MLHAKILFLFPFLKALFLNEQLNHRGRIQKSRLSRQVQFQHFGRCYHWALLMDLIPTTLHFFSYVFV